MLAEQLQTRPTPAIEALAERIRSEKTRFATSQNRGAQVASSASLASSGTRRQVSTVSPALPSIPLVGRAQEFGTVIAAYRATEPGQSSIVIMQGEAGIGKTRMAQEFLGWSLAPGADVLQGRAFETGSPTISTIG